MKYVKGFFDSVYLSYIGWFGGSVRDKTFNMLWSVHVSNSADVEINDCEFRMIVDNEPFFVIHSGDKENKIEIDNCYLKK